MSEHEQPAYEMIGGMLATESPQGQGSRVIDMLERGEAHRVRALIEARAAATAAAIALEIAAAEAHE